MNVNFVVACHVVLEPLMAMNYLSMFYSVQRLAAGEWFAARVSSCGLFHIAYSSAPDQLKAELRTIYGQLCQDDMPMVRRAAASNLGKFAATVEQSHLKTEIMSIFDDLTQDGKFFIHYFMVLNSFLTVDMSCSLSILFEITICVYTCFFDCPWDLKHASCFIYPKISKNSSYFLCLNILKSELTLKGALHQALYQYLETINRA